MRTFCARLMGQANTCEYAVKCPGCQIVVDYTHQIVYDCVTRGLSDDDIRLDILSNENQDMEMDTLVAYIKVKVYVYSPDIPRSSADFTFTFTYSQ